MRRRESRYTLWLARSGSAPKTFNLPVWLPLVLVLVLAGWTAFNLYLWGRTAEMRILQIQMTRLAEQSRRLSLDLEAERARNNALSDKAQGLLKSLESVETQINALRERAGMSKIKLTPARAEPNKPKGGEAIPADLDQVLLAIGQQLSEYNGALSRVAPALDETLRREEARPAGYPLRFFSGTTSQFGYRRNPFGPGFEFHDGLDLAAAPGAPVYATAPGVVVQAGWNGSFGNSVQIDHGYGYKTLYGHLSALRTRVGERVEKGDLVGLVGSTGRSSGPHLHYSVFRYGVAVSPTDFLSVSR
ncbi:MAG: peptidoglycan DD-metalloendopeptidase family protein [Deinococcus sp.]|nr:peptidoglycan DD-metalloendopeptidase family protein [Deinococcus sp.]MCL5965071.1 peptidoglycan DD-metalloendopeptidase family protein [Deinococcus sp.]